MAAFGCASADNGARSTIAPAATAATTPVDASARDVSPTTVSAANSPIGAARSQTCAIEWDTLDLAVATYIALNDAVPTEADLVAGGLLRAESETLDVTADGTVVAAPGSICSN